MTPRVFYAPPNPPARRAGNLLLVLGAVALLFGLSLLFRSGNGDSMPQETDAVREAMSEIDRTFPFGRRGLFVVTGLFVIGYGLGTIVCGALARTGGRVAMSVTLVLTLLAALFVAMAGGLSVVQGAAGAAVLPLFVCVLHGTAARWLLQALARPVVALPAPAEPWVPMRDYYLPPVPPA